MIDKHAFRERLAAIMTEQVELLTEVNGALEQEHLALCQRDADALAATSDRKTELLRRIEALTDGFHGLLEAQGLNPDKAGLAHCVDSPELAALWRTLREKLELCHHSNRVNGAAIELNRASNARIISLLRGDSVSLYGPAGRLQAGGSFLPLGEA